MLQFTERTATVGAAAAREVRNQILQSLSPPHFERLRPYLKPVSFRKNEVIHRANAAIRGIFFIESGLIARTTPSQPGAPVEVAMEGSSGVVGLAAVLAGSTVLNETSAIVPALALKIENGVIQHIFEDQPHLRAALLRQVHCLSVQMGHLSLCNTRHALQTRLPRWLLMAADRLQADTIPVTQELLATLLAVRRPGVTCEMRRLELEGVVAKSRGSIRILDRARLTSQACSCYGLIKDSERPSGPFHAHMLS